METKIAFKDTILMLLSILIIGSIGVILTSYLKFNVFIFFTSSFFFHCLTFYPLYRFGIKCNTSRKSLNTFLAIFFIGTLSSRVIGTYYTNEPDADILALLILIISLLGALYVFKKN